jgi:hypothetical protein
VNDEYVLVKLEDLCKNINKKYKLDDRIYNYVEISNINYNKLTNYTNYSTSELPNKATNKSEYYNILVSCVRPNPSKILLITEQIENIDEYVFSNALVNIELKDKALSYYIYAILLILSVDFEKKLCKGSSYPRFTPKDLTNILIPIPKLDKKINSWIDKLKKSYNDKSFNSHLQELKKEIFQS